MIWESWPWKCYLWKEAAALEKAMSRKALSPGAERSEWVLSKLERTLFTAAFSIRKLIDSQKLSDECLAHSIPAERFPAIGAKRPGLINWHHFDEHFDTGSLTLCRLRTRDLCNLLIHSFQFLFTHDEDMHLDGFLVSSDRYRTSWLYRVDLKDAIEWVRYVATDDVDLTEVKRTPKGDIKVTKARRWQEAARDMREYLQRCERGH